MRKELIYHIGTFKTGSTSLQEFLDFNREKLLQNGIFYPRCLLENGFQPGTSGNAYPLNVIDMCGEDDKKGLEQLKSYFELYDKILLSSEDFWGTWTKTERLNSLKELGVDVKVIVYLRRQDKYIDSFCNQLIKMSLLSFKKSESHAYDTGLYADYSRELSFIEEAIGIDNIVVRVFEKNQLINGDLYDDFLGCIGIKENDFIRSDKRNNESLSNEYREIQNVCNEVLKGMNIKNCTTINYYVMRLSEEYLGSLTKKEISDFLTEEEKLSIIEKYEEGNKIIAKRYLNREDGVLFYEELPDINKKINKKEIEITSVIKLFTLLYAEQCKKTKMR